MTPPEKGRPRLAAAALATAAVTALSCTAGPPPEAAAASGPPAVTKAARAAPNVLYLVTDDQTMADVRLRTMPSLYRHLVDGGTRYTGSVTSTALCCPSRASFQTGQYPHNHGTTECDHRGFETFMRDVDQRQTLPNWLRRAGYRTGFTGKFINGNESPDSPIPGGWTEWRGLARGTYNYWHQQEVVKTPGRPRTTRRFHQYTTTTTGDSAAKMVRRFSRRDASWFVEASFVAPHYGNDGNESDDPYLRTPGVERRYRNTFAGKRLPTDPSYDEADVADKNDRFRRLPLSTPRVRAAQRELWQQRQEALRSVDDQIGRLVRLLKSLGEYDDTVVIFTSDNGYHLGEHRKVDGKKTPYQPAIGVPLYVRGPGFERGATRSNLVQTLDVGPTIADLAGAEVPAFVDGVSFLPSGRDPGWRPDRVTLVRQFSGLRFVGVRTSVYSYFRVADSRQTVELYDHRVDPYELQNVASDPLYADVVAELERNLQALQDCRGRACDLDTAAHGMVPTPAALRHHG